MTHTEKGEKNGDDNTAAKGKRRTDQRWCSYLRYLKGFFVVFLLFFCWKGGGGVVRV